ncbi:MAG TPA: regulatory protein RecX [Gammaproteobacteria bacterium]
MRRSRPDGSTGGTARFRASADIGDDAEEDPVEAADEGGRSTADEAAECERRAVALLARREHSRRELERKLAVRGFRLPLVAETLDRLEQSGLLSGQRFISGFIASRAERGSGPAKIRAELAQRGIRPDEAAAAIAAADVDWAALARRVRTKRFGDPPPRDYAERARQARFLNGRGFEPEHIDAALEVGADSD